MSAERRDPNSVVVIGGGIIGLSCAWEASRRGMQVTVIDRQGEGEDNCSNKNAGMIVPSHFVPLAAPGMVALGVTVPLISSRPSLPRWPPVTATLCGAWCAKRSAGSEGSSRVGRWEVATTPPG